MALCVGGLIALGCERKTTPPSAPAAPAVVAKQDEPVVDAEPKSNEQSEPEQDTSGVSPHEVATTPADETSTQVTPAPTPAERFAILTPGGPLLIDARITVDGEPIAPRRDDASGRVVRPVALRSSRAYAPDPRTASRIWPLVDDDEDGRLSAEELAAASRRLWSLDADDDRTLTPTELATLREQLSGRSATAPSTGRRMTSRVGALALDPHCDLERVDYVLQDMYAPRQNIGPTSFSALPRLFEDVNSGDDEWLDREELARLRTVEPHLALNVAFVKSQPATLEVDSHAPEINVVDDSASDHVLVSIGSTRLVVSATEAAPPADARPPEPDSIMGSAAAAVPTPPVHLMVHDQGDAVFAEIDVDSSGGLSEREIARAGARLLQRDTNRDGALGGDELPYAMIVGYLHGEQPNTRRFFVPTSAPLPAADKAEPPRWFRAADLNGDGDLSPSEFLGDARQFAALDANGDGYVDAAEADAVGGAP
jgi:hypothetical protein